MSPRTDLSALPPPKGPYGDRTNDVALQAVSVPSGWWRRALDEDDRPPQLRGDAATTLLTRQEVWELAADAKDSAAGARRLLWAAVAWGAGHRLRLCLKRIEAVRLDRDGIGERLREAAALVGRDPVRAYELLHPPRRNLVRHLGPAFGTKFLYFAGGGLLEHPALILDSRVATSLVRHGWTSLGTTGGWPSATYARYLERVHAWSRELGGLPVVAADQIEKLLFERGARQG